MDNLTTPLAEEVPRAIERLDFDRTRRTYWEQNECIFIERFLPAEVVQHYLLPEVEKLRAEVHRNYIPKHKKGGVSVITRSWRRLQASPNCIALQHSSILSAASWVIR